MVGRGRNFLFCMNFLHRLRTYNPKTRFSSSASEEGWKLIQFTEIKPFVERCMATVGTKKEHASQLADALIKADYRGHYSHGINRLHMYVKDIKSGITVHDMEPVTVKESAATALVDGQNVLGPVVGNYCMKIAIQKAKETGVGWVVARGSNHYGIAGFYSLQALEEGMMGMSFTNTSPLQVPTRAKKAHLGTNALTLAAPGKEGDSFVLDMATTTVAYGKVEICQRKGTNMPKGWGVDQAGKETTNPDEVLEGGGLMPLGGSEECGGYKGYGLAMLVEIFCGILSGAEWGPNIRKWMKTDRVANLGQCFIAINPENFASGFTDRMQELMDTCRNLEPAEGESEVLVAGDPERKHMSQCDREGGIRYHPNQIAYLEDLAKELGVAPMVSA
ncbi:uncharacterized protein LOC106159668 isoform X2 [Lingula anatina]|uniref:Uncharacterized protein LOC106159668 isoform X2 n=1 Tax=Lingula anatina TaxID=7574 RepID=A0A1S3HZN9_LINAN|nr:uncharacterized protein LOC106159668 isoform X2 [Lingula anatina]|eukprot:XP_013391480.1 uncharacterized protein LOC106159668 isoform X2 [Lingula anatina]